MEPFLSHPPSEYTVRDYGCGIAVFGSVRMDALGDMLQTWEKRGYRWLRTDIADALGASLAIVRSAEDAKAWCQMLDIRPDHPDWLKTGDTGRSSRTIYATFTGQWQVLPNGRRDAAAPRDADDFGRCHRLLQRHPEWRTQLSRVGEHCAEFIPLIAAWGELEKLHDAKECDRLTARIGELTTEK
ncbi:MAG: hypothetical protein PHE83_16745 [Opitutaceae bacterium]|nr:hypothetical protein [Opitutaceae bacterium]